MPAGNIAVAKVTGAVTIEIAGQKTVLTTRQRVPAHATITTATNATVILVFSNGATFQLEADTALVIDDFLQDPFTTNIKVDDLVVEPSASVTKMRLLRGEMVGHLVPLHWERGSTFRVDTPIGELKPLTGGDFRLVFRPSGTGQAVFRLTAARSKLAFQSRTAGAKEVVVSEGREMALTVSVTTGADGALQATVR